MNNRECPFLGDNETHTYLENNEIRFMEKALHQTLHHLEHDVWKFMKSYGKRRGSADPYNYGGLTTYDRFCEPRKNSSRR